MKKVVITGVAGFLGSHLAQKLLQQGIEIIGIDNFCTGTHHNIELLSSPTFTFYEIDVSDQKIADFVDWSDVEEIYHLASPASPVFYQASSLETIAANTVGTRQMLEIARKVGAKLLFTSTSEIYGDPLVNPQPENYRGNVNTWGPRACYDEGKRLGEVFCYEYFAKYGVAVTVARIFNTYSAGLRNDDGRVISNFVGQALSNKPITVYGDGLQTRSFCYVDDMIAALQMMMENEKAIGQILNVGSPIENTILDIARLVKKLANATSEITFGPLPVDDPVKRCPDISVAQKVLGWSPQVTLEEGLKLTIKNYVKLNMKI